MADHHAPPTSYIAEVRALCHNVNPNKNRPADATTSAGISDPSSTRPDRRVDNSACFTAKKRKEPVVKKAEIGFHLPWIQAAKN